MHCVRTTIALWTIQMFSPHKLWGHSETREPRLNIHYAIEFYYYFLRNSLTNCANFILFALIMSLKSSRWKKQNLPLRKLCSHFQNRSSQFHTTTRFLITASAQCSNSNRVLNCTHSCLVRALNSIWTLDSHPDLFLVSFSLKLVRRLGQVF